MNTRNLWGILTLFLCAFSFIGCSNDEEEEGRKITDYKELVLTVASKRVPGVLPGSRVVSDKYAVKKEQDNEWGIYGGIAGFEYEQGYEYKIKVSETTYLDYAIENSSWTECNLLEVISKVQKESEGLPLHLIPETYYKRLPLPEYRYAVEAENKPLIEKDLEANSILPKEYHYMLCSSIDGYKKLIGIQEDNNVFGPYMVKSTSKKPEDMPESYKILPPNGTAVSYGEWTFLDESDNTTNHPSFDVFIVRPTKTKSIDRTPYTVYLYKDLTQHYQAKYPEAEVKTVVVSYTLLLFDIIFE